MHNIYLNRAFFCAIHCIGKHALGLITIHRLNGFSNYRDGERRSSGFAVNAHIDKDRNRALAFQCNCWTTGMRTIIPSVFRRKRESLLLLPEVTAATRGIPTLQSERTKQNSKGRSPSLTTLHLDLCYLYIYTCALNEEAPDRTF